MAKYYSIIHIHHNLFLCSSVDEYLGCIDFWALVNSAMNMCVHYYCLLS